ncbi:hypothetical protein MPER_12304, partial [Moniliophthora perniciosa FA553]
MSTDAALAAIKAQLTSSNLPKKTKTAPSWNKEEPEALVPWLHDLDAIFESANTTNDWVKIQKALEWMDYATKVEMARLEAAKGTHTTASWEKFKKELTACFPEAVSDFDGSRVKLEKLAQKYKYIPADGLDKALAYNRAFRNEVNKLFSAQPNPLMSNAEAVKLYASAFEKKLLREAYAEARRMCSDDLHGRRRDDVFKLDELIKAVESVMYAGTLIQVSDEEEEFETAPRTNKRGRVIFNPKGTNSSSAGTAGSNSAVKQEVEAMEAKLAATLDKMESWMKTAESKAEKRDKDLFNKF